MWCFSENEDAEHRNESRRRLRRPRWSVPAAPEWSFGQKEEETEPVEAGALMEGLLRERKEGGEETS